MALLLASPARASDQQQAVAIKNWPASTNTSVVGNVSVTGTVGVTGPVTLSGPISMSPLVSAKAAITTATITATSTVILKPNDGRKGLAICNSGTGVAYIAYDVTASVKDHTTFMIPAASSWTMPAGTIYTGSIAAVRNDGSAVLFITELQ